MTLASNEGINWLQSLSRFGIKPGLDRTNRVLEAFSCPQHALRFFHVAGTNGKGSVCAFLTAILRVKHVVGTFTSPAFDGYRGRFQVDGVSISDDAFEALALEVKNVVLQVAADDPLTEFEVLTVMAILHFVRSAVEVVVWETGLGGRYDSTNVVSPVVTAITNVGYDHVDILGPCLRDIAYNKAGIIKPGVPVVTAATGEAYFVIEQIAKELGAPLVTQGLTYDVTRSVVTPTYQTGHYRGLFRDVFGINIPLFGAHQCVNLGNALAMYELGCWLSACATATDHEIRAAVRGVVWPMRFEVRWREGFPVVLDGAHNPPSARAFASALAEFSQVSGQNTKGWCMIVGVLVDKDVMPMLQSVLPFAQRVIVTQPHAPRAKASVELAADVRRVDHDVPLTCTDSVAQAIYMSAEYKCPVACFGSLYTVNEARQAMAQQEMGK